MRNSSGGGFLKFFWGFIGIVSLGFFLLLAVGFYQTEVGGNKSISGAGNLERAEVNQPE